MYVPLRLLWMGRENLWLLMGLVNGGKCTYILILFTFRWKKYREIMRWGSEFSSMFVVYWFPLEFSHDFVFELFDIPQFSYVTFLPFIFMPIYGYNILSANLLIGKLIWLLCELGMWRKHVMMLLCDDVLYDHLGGICSIRSELGSIECWFLCVFHLLPIHHSHILYRCILNTPFSYMSMMMNKIYHLLYSIELIV